MRTLLILLLVLAAGCDKIPVYPPITFHLVKAMRTDGVPAYMIQQCGGISGCHLYGYHFPVTEDGRAQAEEVYEYFAHPTHDEVVEVVK